ncbi:FecCD family ABC transporter permease [Synechococcus sp. MIT S1220]|uniref:FecCD family ABC transporter permease n=1 Tax=Synechococcus sp. MIT S1220 TaxID=3082549 RepID=UPI0039AF9F2F
MKSLLQTLFIGWVWSRFLALRIEIAKDTRNHIAGLSMKFISFLGLLWILAIVFVLSLCVGDSPIGFEDLWDYVSGTSSSETTVLVIRDIRLPRTLAALLTGSALGVSGAMLQGMLRNPLASPFLLGISSGSGVCVVILFSLNSLAYWIPLGAWLGAVVSALIVFCIAYDQKRISLERLILSGVAVSSVLGSVQAIFLLRSDDTRIQNSLTWLSGTLAGREWGDLTFTWIPIVVCLLCSFVFAKQLNLALLDDDTSRSLGLSLTRLRILIGVCATLLTSCSVCIAGLVGFVGLVIPHIARLLCGGNFVYVLPFSGVLGALTVVVGDLIARMYLWELPVGIVTALFGSPFFIYLLRKRRMEGSV